MWRHRREQTSVSSDQGVMSARETLRQYDACIRELEVEAERGERDKHLAICVR